MTTLLLCLKVLGFLVFGAAALLAVVAAVDILEWWIHDGRPD